jgi:hypothetical protein
MCIFSLLYFIYNKFWLNWLTDACHLGYITKLKKGKKKRKEETTPGIFLLALLVVKTSWGNNSFSLCR